MLLTVEGYVHECVRICIMEGVHLHNKDDERRVRV